MYTILLNHPLRAILCIVSICMLTGWLPPLTVGDEEFSRSYSTEIALNAPSTFGKTHFIFGYSPEESSASLATSLQSRAIKKDIFSLRDDGRVCSVLFVPDKAVRKKLVALIDREKKYIRMAAFMLTNKQVADALIRARNRGVSIEIITDPICIQDRSNKIAMLYDKSVSLYIYQSTDKGIMRSLMHDKFILFEDNIYDRSIVWTGSANFTSKGTEKNQENILVLDDKSIYDSYKKQFERLKKRSESYKDSLVTNAELHHRISKVQNKIADA